MYSDRRLNLKTCRSCVYVCASVMPVNTLWCQMSVISIFGGKCGHILVTFLALRPSHWFIYVLYLFFIYINRSQMIKYICYCRLHRLVWLTLYYDFVLHAEYLATLNYDFFLLLNIWQPLVPYLWLWLTSEYLATLD